MQICLELFHRFFKSSLKGVSCSSRSALLAFAVFNLLAIAGCSSAVDDTQRAWMNKIFRPYVPDMVQGNFISSEQYAKLQVGQTREQVRQILGTPLLASYFHANRWDYVFEFKRAGQRIGKERHVTVFFDGDKVVKFEGDALPTEVELVAEIDDYAKNKRSFWDVVTGSNKAPETPPLQQPELLVPSPTDNLTPGTVIPPAAQPVQQTEVVGPGAMNIPAATETKQ
jgi:outer membrane protein assembly factor BamE